MAKRPSDSRADEDVGLVVTKCAGSVFERHVRTLLQDDDKLARIILPMLIFLRLGGRLVRPRYGTTDPWAGKCGQILETLKGPVPSDCKL